VTPANIAASDISLKTRFFGLHFNHFYVIHPESYQIRWNYAKVGATTPFTVIQAHRFWYQSKAYVTFSKNWKSQITADYS